MKYSWKPDIPDHRDQIFTASFDLPTKVDRIGLQNPIENQGQLGSCTGNSSTSALEIVTNSPPLSRLMAYYNGRAIEKTIRQDAGCEIRDVIKAISKLGVCEEKLWPYVVKKFKTKPSVPARAEALSLITKIKAYQRVLTLEDLKKSLALGYPVIFGFSVPEYFESEAVATTGLVKYPGPSDKIIGGHAVVAVGYDDTGADKFVWVRNSWGADWGIDGYFKMDQAWFTGSGGLVDDMWAFIPV